MLTFGKADTRSRLLAAASAEPTHSYAKSPAAAAAGGQRSPGRSRAGRHDS